MKKLTLPASTFLSSLASYKLQINSKAAADRDADETKTLSEAVY